jgi:hypothetical protein
MCTYFLIWLLVTNVCKNDVLENVKLCNGFTNTDALGLYNNCIIMKISLIKHFFTLFWAKLDESVNTYIYMYICRMKILENL